MARSVPRVPALEASRAAEELERVLAEQASAGGYFSHLFLGENHPVTQQIKITTIKPARNHAG